MAQLYSLSTFLSMFILLNISLIYAHAQDEVYEIDKDNLLSCRNSPQSGISAHKQIERSDWVNVKTDIVIKAKGDGINDDTLAIQSAIDYVKNNPNKYKVVYLPSGKYKISKTLIIEDIVGASIIGDGSETILEWYGEYNGRMIWSNGATRHNYISIVFDGKNKAGVGIDHDSKIQYETRIKHENIHLKNFIKSAIRVGSDQVFASAEMQFNNMVFERNAAGVTFLSANDYNNIFDGCHFVDNQYGVRAPRGNVTVRNTKFLRSSNADLELGAHSHSIRRVISKNSNVFIRSVDREVSNSPITVQDSHIDGWKNDEAAILTSTQGPLIVFDTTFKNPFSAKSYPIKFNNPGYITQVGLIYNLSTPSVTKFHEGDSGEIIDLNGHGAGSFLSGDEVFIIDRNIPSKNIVDVRVDCRAKGDGIHDDLSKIQKCIDQYKRDGWDTDLYFPVGKYRISESLTISDAEFKISGSGWRSSIILDDGAESFSAIDIISPNGLVLKDLSIGSSDNSYSIRQGGDKPAYVTYQGVYAYHDDEMRKLGAIFENVPKNSVVVARHLDGRVDMHDIRESIFLLTNLMSVQFKSKLKQNNNFIGVQSMVSCCEDIPLISNGRSSLIISDWYNEQSEMLLKIEGDHLSDSIEITLSHSQAAFNNKNLSIIKNFSGEISHFGGIFGQPHVDMARLVDMEASANADVLFVGNQIWHKVPYSNNKNIRGLINSIHKRNPILKKNAIFTQQLNASLIKKTISALKNFRALGEMDKALSYCN